MSGSFSFFFHIVGVGLVSAIVLGGWVVNRRIVKEKDVKLQLYVSQLSRPFGLASPFVVLLLLITGIGNIYNRELGTSIHWYNEGWLVAKLFLFAIFAVNGGVFGAVLGRRRTALLRTMSEEQPPERAEDTLKNYNRQFSWHYLVQFLLLVIIIALSIFGDGRHPGVF